LAARGIRHIDGALILDEGNFSAPGPAPGWPADAQLVREYCALPAGFSANGGCLNVALRPASPGAAPTVSLQPRAHGLEENIAVTTGARKSTLRVALEARHGRVLVKGSLPADVPLWTARCAHPDPVALFGEALCATLEEGGVTLAGGWRRGSPPERGPPLLTLTSALAECLVPINTDSNNAVAEQVFLALGNARHGQGTRSAGAQACAAMLVELGCNASGFIQADGSGLSRNGRASARQLVTLIAAVLRGGGEEARLFRSSLAVAGRSGTLAKRMTSGPAAGRVRAKTGWIEGASALSGVVELDDGRRRVFSILVSYPRLQGLNRSIWKPMQDEICAILAGAQG
ncbi:MAG: D-alanyl-D-alanine carboxypeptidase/D-alanyl-D-alanine-endopeptidase, partial [Planctomycetota bacterium]|nr:D-alanyl-D-alanine carboxypeptidase/D-alanyl-D-alanine-endopeptidase [Planctomycetota bacterium]